MEDVLLMVKVKRNQKGPYSIYFTFTSSYSVNVPLISTLEVKVDQDGGRYDDDDDNNKDDGNEDDDDDGKIGRSRTSADNVKDRSAFSHVDALFFAAIALCE